MAVRIYRTRVRRSGKRESYRQTTFNSTQFYPYPAFKSEAISRLRQILPIDDAGVKILPIAPILTHSTADNAGPHEDPPPVTARRGFPLCVVSPEDLSAF